MFRAEIWGGAGEHGRSCYFIRNERRSVLLDCGVKKEKEDMYPMLDAAKVSKLNAVFLSHAHEDHSMAIPLLYRYGYTGEVWTTRSTVRQLTNYYANWRRFVQDTWQVLPYTSEHVEQVRYRFFEEESPPEQWFEIEPGLQICWGASGHLVGSIWLLLKLDGQTLFYSGDYCRESRLFPASLPNPANLTDIEFAIIDAAYADDEEEQEQLIDQLVFTCKEVLEQGGHVWLPVPMFGRGHELAAILAEMFPDVDLVCDQGLETGVRALVGEDRWLKTEAFQIFKRVWDSRVRVLSEEQLSFRSVSPGNAIFFTSDPMLQSGGSAYLLEAFKHHRDNVIIFTGHVYHGTRAARMLAGEDHDLRVIRCRYKIHQGFSDVKWMLDRLHPGMTLLAHAPKGKTDRLQAKLMELGYKGIYSCTPGEAIDIRELSDQD